MRLVVLAERFILDDTYNVNGTLVQLYNLSVAFAEQGIEVHYVCQRKETKAIEINSVHGIQIHRIAAYNKVYDWKRLIFSYERVLNDIAPNVVYTRGRTILTYVAGRFAKNNNISFVWGTNGEDGAEFWKNFKRYFRLRTPLNKKIILPLLIYQDLYINRGMKLARYIVNQTSYQQKRTLENHGIRGILIPNYFVPRKVDVSKSNQLLWLANLSRSKQPEVFISIISKLKESGWNSTLAGGTSDKGYFTELKELSKDSGIHFSGKVDFFESFEYFQKAKLYVNTSKMNADGLPNAFIQSWLSGTPVLSLNHDPNNWMRDFGIGFCSHGDKDILIQKINELINDTEQLEVMAQRSRLFAIKTFANDEIIKSYIKLFRQ